MKNIKKMFIIFLTIFLVLIMSINIYAINTVEELIGDSGPMSGVKDMQSTDGDSGVGTVLNTVIGLLQIAGTGIAVITVTLLGAKYMLSSVDQKAEIKNKATPIVIGCVILFGAVNLVAMIADFTNKALGDG
jgi:type IV secretory pathway VirB2 component (pilin)